MSHDAEHAGRTTHAPAGRLKSVWQRRLLQVVDFGLAACIVVVPFLMGGRHAVGQLALVAAAVTVAVAWGARECLGASPGWRYHHAMLVLLGGAVLLAIQWTPLPESVWRAASPRGAELLPMWTSDAPNADRLGHWNRVSMTPEATRGAAAVFLAYGLIFFVALQRIEGLRDLHRILRWCALAAVAMAAFGLLQYFAGNGRFFWFHQTPFQSTRKAVTGSFTNRNHFAQFLALGIGPLVWWLCHGVSSFASSHEPSSRKQGRHGPHFGARKARYNTEAWWIALGAAVVFLAGLLSLSRGGSAALFLAATIAAVICCRAAAVQGRVIGALAGAGTLIVVALTIFGLDRVSQRLDDFTSGSLEVLDREAGRRTIWATVIRAIPDFALLGSGVGSHRDVYPIYLENPPEGLEFTHAENGYLQVALETGVVGATLMAAGIGFCGWWCVAGLWRAEDKRLKMCLGAIAAGLAANVVHSLVDFVWYVPGCMAMVAVLAACACRAWQLAEPEGSAGVDRFTLPRPALVAATAVVALVGAALTADRVGPAVAQAYWDRYVVDTQAESQTAQHALASASLDPSKSAEASEPPESAAAEAIELEESHIRRLNDILRWQPGHARARMALVQSHLRLFDLLQASAVNPMSLPNVRDAAIQSRSYFHTRQEQDAWLRRAVGEHSQHLEWALHHVRLALNACPLDGKGYVFLGELAFLDGGTAETKRRCMEQAVRVRPFDGFVLHAAANEAWLAGKPEQWLAFSQKAFRNSRVIRKRIVDDLIGNTPPGGLDSMIDFVLRQFEPDLAGLSLLQAACEKQAQPGQLDGFLRYFAQRAEYEAQRRDGRKSALTWLLARSVHLKLGDKARALQCARQAYEAWPNDFRVRDELAVSLIDAGQFAEAQEHLKWCLQRNPRAKWLEGRYRQALNGDLDQRVGVETR